MSYFKNMLSIMGINPNDYLEDVNENAKKYGYTPVYFSNNNKFKLMILSPNNKLIHFGSAINNDFIIYQYLEDMKREPKGTAQKRRKAYLSRATNIKGNWKQDKYSKNNLAIKILWQ